MIEFGEKQFFLPDRMNNSIIQDIDKINDISTHQLKFKYLGMKDGCHLLNLYYGHCSQWEHRSEYGAILEKKKNLK